jgi:hypothetical protein
MSQSPHTSSPPASSTPPPEHEEPEITQEEAVPSDGRDEHGEQMMRELGQNKPGPKLAETPAPEPTKESKS